MSQALGAFGGRGRAGKGGMRPRGKAETKAGAQVQEVVSDAPGLWLLPYFFPRSRMRAAMSCSLSPRSCAASLPCGISMCGGTSSAPCLTVRKRKNWRGVRVCVCVSTLEESQTGNLQGKIMP